MPAIRASNQLILLGKLTGDGESVFHIGTIVTGWNYADKLQVKQPISNLMNFFQKNLDMH